MGEGIVLAPLDLVSAPSASCSLVCNAHVVQVQLTQCLQHMCGDCLNKAAHDEVSLS